MKTLIAVLALAITACANSPKTTTPTSSNTTPVRQPAGFENLGDIAAGPSVMYQGPFIVGDDGPKRQPAKVYLPVQYNTKPSWPLVVLLHGFTATGDLQNYYLGLSARVSLRGFILVTPNGTLTPKNTTGEKGRKLDNLPFWNATDACCDFGKTAVDDAGYLTRVIEEVKAKYNVDTKKIYIFGHSNGGFMANRMACEMGEQIAAVASLAGGAYKDPGKCAKAAPVNYLQIHATDDETINYFTVPEYAGGEPTVQQWIKRNGCSEKPKRGPASDHLVLIPFKDTTSQVWDRCASGKKVELWTIRAYTTSYHNSHAPLFSKHRGSSGYQENP